MSSSSAGCGVRGGIELECGGGLSSSHPDRDPAAERQMSEFRSGDGNSSAQPLTRSTVEPTPFGDRTVRRGVMSLMDQEQQRLVRASFAKVAPIADIAAACFIITCPPP